MMNISNSIRIMLLALTTTMFSSCAVVEGIFKAGMGVGIFIVVAIIALLIFIIVRIGRGRK
ncbi:phosphatidate cytidylyltransferase [Lacibacter sp. H407]|uniref:phosphatidate cytidylyltransferase n=1 Tax=Lacibacter sp. H407 TaxID=3133423 RepID=UPI0030BA98B5